LLKGAFLGVASLLRHRKRLKFAPGLPHLVHIKLEANGKSSAEQLTQLRAILAGFTPAVDQASSDSFSLNFFGSPHLNGDFVAILCRMQLEILKFTGKSTRIGAGRSKVLAELACNCKSNPGVQVVAAGSEKSFLERLPVEALTNVGNFKGFRLRDRGIATIGELCRVPRPALRNVYGLLAGDRLWLNARGFDARPSVVT
jgi:DNA polymerase-4